MSTYYEPPSPQFAPRHWALSPEPEPVFGLGAVWAVVLSVGLAVLLCGGLALLVASHIPALAAMTTAQLAQDPRVLLPAQFAAYCLVLAGLARWFGLLGMGFARAIHWNWPERPLGFAVGGAMLGLIVQVISNLIPSPPELPIDKMLRTPLDAWMMTIFGVLLAPFAEEVFFRGLLFPALSRRTGAVISLVLSSLLFGYIHAGQLGHAWGQVACIAGVGAVLTAVRWRFHSLASSMLVHMGYNAALFVTLFAQTQGFTNMHLQ